MNQHRYPHPRRFAQNRTADISAGADGNIRPELFENSGAGPAGGYRMDSGRDVAPYVLQAQPSLKPPDIHGLNRIARCRYQIGLHSALGADKQNLRRGILLFDFVGDG